LPEAPARAAASSAHAPRPWKWTSRANKHGNAVITFGALSPRAYNSAASQSACTSHIPSRIFAPVALQTTYTLISQLPPSISG
jgi:hypothetical protein